MTASVAVEPLAQVRPSRQAGVSAFIALLARDLAVLLKTVRAFLLRTIMQPLLFVFVFTYVFPKIGQRVSGDFSTLIVPGVIAIALIFQGIQAVALPLVQDFGYTREIEDRVMAPLPVWGVALEKMASGAIQGILAAVVVFPLAAFIPVTAVHLHVNWAIVLTVVPLAAYLSAALGLTIGTRTAPQQVPLLFSVIVIPITFLGATYYPWGALKAIPWLKWAVLVNPLVYMSEGFRQALAPQPLHMNLTVTYLALIAYSAFLTWAGLAGFRKRVLA